MAELSAGRYGFSTAFKTAKAERDANKAKEGQLGQQVLNALLGMATAYVTGGAGAALGGQLMGGGAASAAGAMAPSAANVLPAFESGISSLTGKGGETPNEAAQYGMAQGLSQAGGSLKQKFAEDLVSKKWGALQAANKGLVPGKITFGAEGGVTRTLEQPKVVKPTKPTKPAKIEKPRLITPALKKSYEIDVMIEPEFTALQDGSVVEDSKGYRYKKVAGKAVLQDQYIKGK